MRKTICLGDMATYINGYAFKPIDWGTKGLPIIRIQNLTDTGKEYNYYDGEVKEKYLVKKGDVLISWSASIGVFEWEKEDAWLNQHIFKVVFDKGEVDKQYFKYVTGYVLKKSLQHAHGSTMKHLTRGTFDKLPIPIYDLKEQRVIAEKIGKVDEAIAECDAMLADFDLLVKSRFIEMFGDPVTNDMNWETDILKNLGELNRGVSKHRPRNAPELLGGPYPLVQTGDVSNADTYINDYSSTYSEIGLKQSRMWSKGTLCITIAANIAQTGILTFDACFPDSVVGFISGSRTNQMYMHYWFSFFQKILEEQAPQSAQKNINLQILSNLSVMVPPLELQEKFAKFVELAYKSKLTIQKSMDNLQELRNSLLQEYFG
ncbi:restriction endonuclease subunit S [Selenomonas sp. AB3002]|uniref:restriction endonuclease subunit S n=1 Tax=Selenomonas sp. AB3002 TaxID=1392502 RepID=UPI00068CC38F